MLKTFFNCSEDLSNKILYTYEKYLTLEHANIRKIEGFIIEKG